MVENNHNIGNFNDVKSIIKEHVESYQGGDNEVIEPDWDSWTITVSSAPWVEDGTKSVVQASFRDPLLHGYNVMVVADTVPMRSGAGPEVSPDRITTMVMRFPRCILPEVNTHRVFSRNSASSRARSYKTTIQPIMEDAYVPLFTKNQKGMGGAWTGEKAYMSASRYWLRDRDHAVASTLRMLLGDKYIQSKVGVMNWCANYTDLICDNWDALVDGYMEHYRNDDVDEYGMPSIHKQDANRLLEPFMWHEALVTSTYWRNFLDLRISDAAMPEIKALAILVREALNASIPEESWVHMPFGDVGSLNDSAVRGDWERMSDILMGAASECARISYKDRSSMKNRNNTDLGRRLLADKHMSPFEHIAFDAVDAVNESEGFKQVMDELDWRDMSSNLSTAWVQYRRVVSAREQ